MKHVVAVPARYNKAMQIPEGVTHWDREAMWADGSSTVDNLLANCSGVTIPSTMQEIADDQLAMLNRLYSNRKNTSNPFTITVAAGNTAFYPDENGALCRGSTVTFQNADGTLLQRVSVVSGATPVYKGATPLKAADNAYTYTFAGWSDGENTYGLTDTLPAVSGDVTYTAMFTKSEKPTLQDWQSVTIADQIYINFLLAPRDGFTCVTIEYIGQDKQQAAKTVVYDDLDDLTFVDGHYLIPVEIAPAQIGDTIRATLEAGNETIGYETSVADYCKALIDGEYDENDKALAKATLEYGQAANDYFAGTGYYHASDITTIEDAQAAVADAAGLENHMSVSANGKISSISYMAVTKPEFRFCTTGLTEAEAVALNDKITVNGSANAQFVKNAETGKILLEVTGIEAANLDEIITITIDGFGTITFCGNDFARLLAKNASTATLGAALYLYGVAAKACFA